MFNLSCLRETNQNSIAAKILNDKYDNEVFSYNGNPVAFSRGENLMINATQMASAFGKRPYDWLKNQSTKEFINELGGVRNIVPSDLVQVINGDGGGTWMHEDVAREFARWLSPKFAIWTNDCIKKILTSCKEDFTTNSIQNSKEKEFVEIQFLIADKLSERLRLNDASVLGLYQSIAEPYNLKLPNTCRPKES